MKASTCKLIKRILLTGMISIPFSQAHAAIIDYGTHFSDTDTGLNWLDVTTTVNRSYNDVSSQFYTGGEFSGWRYATRDEFQNLLIGWTGVSPSVSGKVFTTGTSPSVDYLVTLFGSTLDSMWSSRFGQTWDSYNGYAEGEGIDFSLGILSNEFNGASNQHQVAAIWDNESNGEASDFFNAEHRQVYVNDAKSDIGSFLVKDESETVSAVTEPQALLLFGVGLLGLMLSRKRSLPTLSTIFSK